MSRPDAAMEAASAAGTPARAVMRNARFSIKPFFVWESREADAVGRKYSRLIPRARMGETLWKTVMNIKSNVPPPTPQADRIPEHSAAIKLIIGFSPLHI